LGAGIIIVESNSLLALPGGRLIALLSFGIITGGRDSLAERVDPPLDRRNAGSTHAVVGPSARAAGLPGPCFSCHGSTQAPSVINLNGYGYGRNRGNGKVDKRHPSRTCIHSVHAQPGQGGRCCGGRALFRRQAVREAAAQLLLADIGDARLVPRLARVVLHLPVHGAAPADHHTPRQDHRCVYNLSVGSAIHRLDVGACFKTCAHPMNTHSTDSSFFVVLQANSLATFATLASAPTTPAV